jgi:hypothetical protein
MGEPNTRELAFAPTPGSMVSCPVKDGAQIGAGRCVEWQRDNGCHCDNALVSLRVVEEALQGRSHQEPEDDARERIERLDDVRRLIVRAEQIEKQRPEVCAHCGRKPGDKAPDGRLVLHMKCQRVDCERIHCTACLNAGIAHPPIEKQRPRPAKEEEMPEGVKSDPCEKCGGRVGTRQPGKVCAKCAGANGKPETSAPPKRNARQAWAKAPRAPEGHGGDVVSILKAQLSHHQEQARKIEKALEVLA